MFKLSVSLAVLCLLNQADARRLKSNDAFVQVFGDRFDESFEEEADKAKSFNQFDGLNHYGKNAFDATGQLVGGVNFSQNLQLDVQSDPICNSAGCTQYKHPKKDDGYDKDYPVVNLGVDRDIIDDHENLPIAEKIVGHHWVWDDSDRPKKIKYDYSPKLEGDMIDAKVNLDLAENQLSHKYASWMTK